MSTELVSKALYMYMNSTIHPLLLANVREYYERFHDCAIVSKKLAMDIALVRLCVAQLSL